MIDFTENIDSLELMVWNFVLNPDNDGNELRPSSHDSLRREELITMVRPNYFNDDDRQEAFKAALKFFKEYEKIPNKKELSSYLELIHVNLTEEEFSSLYQFNLKEFNYDYLYTYVRAFILLRNLNLTVMDLMTYLKTTAIDPKNIDKISEKIRNDISSKLALNFSSADTGLNFFNPESHIQIAKTGCPTGFPFLDKVQGGGWNAKALVVFQGRPKVGKSMVLGNIAARSFLAGNVTGLVTVELADRQYMKRIGSNILGIKSEDYARITDADAGKLVHKKIEELKADGRNIGELIIKEFPTGGATAIDIENYFLRLEQKLNKKFKVIVVDYLNLLKPINNQNGLYEKIKAISEELRGVAMRNEWCVISATQIRREDIDNFDLGMDSVAESFGLIHTVDSLFGLMRSPLESRMKIKVIANRDNGYEESYKFYTMNKDFFRLTEEVGLNSEFYSDDEEVTRMADELRNEYTEASQTLVNPTEDDYDALFNSM
ncbi:DnaB Replicative DNA helicase [uncultured Caudovirales phage]|uniref:DnaB Replicative DNA helicase n=1 Tax=uncultured Caudovirales phage TaxID=2100421 RepID=A0A6J5NUZ3_9CAUD|nr:DnaB Replicative DNA helicase [uncultured Caudovirales phage]